MRVVTLTSEQKLQAAANAAEVKAALNAYQVVQKMHQNYLRTTAQATATTNVSLSDDGAFLIVG